MPQKNASRRMPALFIGHGSPMNAIADNDFTRALGRLGQALPHPKAILCVSAHWLTEGTFVTHMREPKTIHDFYGFPKPLFDVRYPAPGSPALAEQVRRTAAGLPGAPLDVQYDERWGLDHGSWSVLRHMYPKADIPVLQLSIDIEKPGPYHLDIGRKLRGLRDEGLLIVASGNVVHNLGNISWEADAKPFEWALEFDEWVKAKLLAGDTTALASEYLATAAGRLAVPTPDHYYPLLYALGAGDSNDRTAFEYEGIQNGSISMRSLSLTAA